MKKRWIACITFAAGAFSSAAFAVPGEYWEITSKTEMPGMPFAIPPTMIKACIPKGGEKDPRQTAPNKDCQMADIKTSGNKVTWKVSCNQNGTVMNGSGEITSSPDNFDGNTQITGNAGGMAMNMSMVYHGKRVGGSCEAVQPGK